MEENLIAPCGMNCALCISYLTGKEDLNHKGFKKRSCPGCIPRGKHCVFLKSRRELLERAYCASVMSAMNFPVKDLNRWGV